MTKRNYYIAVHYTSSNSWVGEPSEKGYPRIADGIQEAKPFTLKEAEAFVAARYEPEGWIKWAIYKIELVASHKDSPLERLAREAEE